MQLYEIIANRSQLVEIDRCRKGIPYIYDMYQIRYFLTIIMKKNPVKRSGPPEPKRVPHGRPVKQTNKQTWGLKITFLFYVYFNYLVVCAHKSLKIHMIGRIKP